MAEVVHFVPARFDDAPDVWSAKIEALYRAADLGRIIAKNDLVAIKLHFGEERNTCCLRPQHVAPLAACVKASQGKPFLADTSTLYAGRRSNAVDHQLLAHEHGFTVEATGAPVVMLDGLFGSAEIEVPIDGKDGRKVALAADVVRAQACVVFTHVTGHCQAGLGGLIKNVGMGTASRKGKLHQHSASKPRIDPEACVACGECVEWCPASAIDEDVDASAMVISDERCIGCGECLTVCRNGAVKFDWKVGSVEMQRKMVEQTAGFHHQKAGKVAYVSCLVNVSKDCDCIGKASEIVIDDIGVLAGFAPLAVEQATLDLIHERSGRTITEHYWPDFDPTVAIEHGKRLGLGSTDYEITEVSVP
jgi:uncharacterized protein